jgi:hypothetical protein
MLFARRSRSLPDALLAVAESLERHAAEIRRLAGQPGATITTAPPSPPAAADPWDSMTIDVAHLDATEEEFARRDAIR